MTRAFPKQTSTGHPDAGRLAESLSEFAASGAPRSVDQVVQIKVTLTGWRPAIWRRVLVSATSTLGDVHRVIQILYGWDGDHPHDFKVGNEHYGDPLYGPVEAADEEELRLPEAFGPNVKKVEYEEDEEEEEPAETEPFSLTQVNDRLRNLGDRIPALGPPR